MEYNVHEISNAVMIDSLDTIIHQESWKLEKDKNTGLLAQTSKLLKMKQSIKEKEMMDSQNIPLLNNLRSQPSKLNHVYDHISEIERGHSPKLSHSCDRISEIERLANIFTQSPSYFTTNNNDNSIDVKHNQVLPKEKITIQTHNELNNYNILLNNENITNTLTPDIKVKRNVRFGEYSPFNPANQVNSQPFLGLGEYDNKKKKILELQRKEYLEYLSKAKQANNISDLPKLAAYSCEEAFKTALEDNNNSEQIKLVNKTMHNQEDTIQLAPFTDGVESCANEGRIRETNRLKQEHYRYELSKQIEEKRKLEQEQKRKEQIEDEAIERTLREQEEKMKKEFEKEAEKRTLAQLQKQFQQEKLKNEIMKKQNKMETKSWNFPTETISHQISKHSRHESFEDYDVEDIHCPSESTFDNVPLPTTRVRVPRKIVYDDEPLEVRKTRDVSCNTDMFKNPCINYNISPVVTRQNMERAHVSFAKESPQKKSEHNSLALLPTTKSVIIDSPHTLALAGLDDCEDDKTCEAIMPTETSFTNEISKEVLLGSNHEMLTDKHLLSNLGNIRKQLDIEHQKLKQQVRRSQ